LERVGELLFVMLAQPISATIRNLMVTRDVSTAASDSKSLRVRPNRVVGAALLPVCSDWRRSLTRNARLRSCPRLREQSMDHPTVVSDPELMGGTPVFAGTRVPVRILFEHLEAGDSIDVFLDDFPTVSRELAIAVLEDARAAVAPDAHPA
jgi:uncharacterized protein (DUF433 family)